MALAEAEYRPPGNPAKITTKHIEAVVNLSKKFREYLNKVHKGNSLDNIAAKRGDRARDG